MTQNIKRSICLTPGMLEELQIFASSKNITVAEAIRYLLERGLSLTMFTEEQDTIRRFIREEIENTLAVTMKQYMERLIKCRQLPPEYRPQRYNAMWQYSPRTTLTRLLRKKYSPTHSDSPAA